MQKVEKIEVPMPVNKEGRKELDKKLRDCHKKGLLAEVFYFVL